MRRTCICSFHPSCEGLLGVCHESITAIRTWLGGALDGRFSFWIPAERKRVEWLRKAEILKLVRDRLRLELENFRTENRYVAYAPAHVCVCVCVLKKPSQDISFLNHTNKPLRRQMRQTPI